MTSILEPFASKRRPNESGTCSVYASVNASRTVENNEGEVFKIQGDTATTAFSIVAPSVTVGNPTGDKNVVNKEYCDSTFVTEARCDGKYLSKSNVIDTTLRPGDPVYNVYNTNVIDYKFYSKEVIDEKLGGKVNNDYLEENYYKKTEVDTKLTESQFNPDNYYTKTSLDTHLHANYYDKDETDAKLVTKATTVQLQEVYQNTYDKGQVYNKTEVDEKITTLNNNFDNYYNKTETDEKLNTLSNSISSVSSPLKLYRIRRLLGIDLYKAVLKKETITQIGTITANYGELPADCKSVVYVIDFILIYLHIYGTGAENSYVQTAAGITSLFFTRSKRDKPLRFAICSVVPGNGTGNCLSFCAEATDYSTSFSQTKDYSLSYYSSNNTVDNLGWKAQMEVERLVFYTPQ